MSLSTTLSIIRGDSKIYNLVFTDADGEPVDLTDATLFFTVKDSLSDDDEDAQIVKEITSHTDADGGLSQIVLTPDDTNIAPRTYYYDIQLKFLDGTVNSINYGEFEVIADVTRREEALTS